MKKQPKKGERWYIKLPGASCIMCSEVEDIILATKETKR